MLSKGGAGVFPKPLSSVKSPWMYVNGAVPFVSGFCSVTPLAAFTFWPGRSWNTLTSVESQLTGPSTMYGFGCLIRRTGATSCNPAKLARTTMSRVSAVKALPSLKWTSYVKEIRWGTPGDRGSSMCTEPSVAEIDEITPPPIDVRNWTDGEAPGTPSEIGVN